MSATSQHGLRVLSLLDLMYFKSFGLSIGIYFLLDNSLESLRGDIGLVLPTLILDLITLA